MSDFKLGRSNFEQRVKKNYFKLSAKQPELIVRILPPMFSGAERGQWSKYQRVEFGYFNSKGKMVPFLDTRVVNRQTKMVEVESQAYLKRMKLKAAKENLIKNGGSEEDKKKITEMIQRFNMAASHSMNVVTLNGEVGLLSVSGDMFDAIKKELKRLEAEGIDATSVETGRFLILSREGERLDTKYYAREYKTKKTVQVDGQAMAVEVPFNHVLDDALIKRLPREAFDLNTLHIKLTPEEADSVVLGAPEVLDALVEKYRGNPSEKKEVVAKQEEAEYEYEEEAEEKKPIAVNKPVVAASVSPAPSIAPASSVAPVAVKVSVQEVVQAKAPVEGENLNEWLAKMGVN